MMSAPGRGHYGGLEASGAAELKPPRQMLEEVLRLSKQPKAYDTCTKHQHIVGQNLGYGIPIFPIPTYHFLHDACAYAARLHSPIKIKKIHLPGLIVKLTRRLV